MSKNNENKLVPRLRFPEFKDKEHWELMQISDILNAENSSLALSKLELKQSGYAVYGADGIIGHIDIFKHKHPYISIVKDGSGVGRLNLCEGKTSILGTLSALKSKDEKKYQTEWAYYLLNTIDFSSYIKGSGIPHIYYSDYKSQKIGVPKPDEQKKIAACLSSLDELITAESKKLELLKEHKKGLLQNLFPQEGETVPRLRFPEFIKDGEWQSNRMGNVYSFITTNSLSRDDLNYVKGEVKNIHYGDIHTKFPTLFDITKEKVPYINESIPLDKFKRENYCKEGDLIFADASEDLKDVGKSIELVNLNNEKLLSGLHTLLARQINSEFAIGFGGYLFLNDRIRKQIQRESQGTKVLGISAKRLSNIHIFYPKEKKEQQKIAACLSSLDEIISAQSKKIEALQLHKKGLLQGLFPNINEVTV